MADQKYIVGIDVGGTFTDLLCLDTKTQELLSEKVPSIPGRQWEGVLGALEKLGILSEKLDDFLVSQVVCRRGKTVC